jgi:predicted phosphodiesterase
MTKFNAKDLFVGFHGDVIFKITDEVKGEKAIPRQYGKKESVDFIIAEGEVTGHAHRISNKSNADIRLSNDGNFNLITNSADVVITHDEHNAVTIPKGLPFETSITNMYNYEEQKVAKVID